LRESSRALAQIIYRKPDTSQWRHIRFYDVIIQRTRILAHLSLFISWGICMLQCVLHGYCGINRLCWLLECAVWLYTTGEDPLADDHNMHDIDSVAGVLKLYFRGLKNPLFPREKFSDFIACVRKSLVLACWHNSQKKNLHFLYIVKTVDLHGDCCDWHGSMTPGLIFLLGWSMWLCVSCLWG